MARPRDLAPYGIEPYHFRRLLLKGQPAQVSRGLYRSVGHEPNPHHRLAKGAKQVPNGLTCLPSALFFHKLGTDSPAETWVAINRKSRLPLLKDKTVRFIRFSGAALWEGVEEHEIEERPVKMSSCCRSIAAAFNYCRKIAKERLNLALEARHTCLRQKRCPPDTLLKCARTCRFASIIRLYLQALAPTP